ncbi:MAG: ABC transporter ATP-binding protein, partial [Clostridia bacterium]|nr:ABC transporter ATP-binding protein [Clostridia bacterium]
MTDLVLDRVHVSYGTNEVVKGVSFQIHGGELCALLGLNGSGKSTLIKAVCGLLKCEAERLEVDGKSLLKLNERMRAQSIAYIPQRSGAASGLTVADLLLMGYNPWLGLLDRPTKEQRRAAVEMLDKVGLGGREEKLFDELSEGQKQLVIFARALVQNAPVMLLDEPDSALDFVNRHQLLGRMAELVREGGKAGLITLHDPNFAMAYCDRLLLLKG